ncbi:MAG: wax ester/triacylglycerol synthase family O-acyltransferase [Myxococcota bacterium]
MSHRSDPEPLSGVDNAWLRMDQPNNPMVIHGLMNFSDPIDVSRLRHKLEVDLEPFVRFQQKIIDHDTPSGRAKWAIDETFSYERHVVEHRLSAPADKETLQDFVGDLMGAGLSYDEPLWQIYVINNLESGSAIVVQIHHAIADGFALVYLMLALADEGAEIELPIGEAPQLPRDRDQFERAMDGLGTPWETALNLTTSLVSGSRKAMGDPKVMKQFTDMGGRVAGALGRLLAMPPETETSMLGQLTTQKVAAWSEGLPLDALKDVSRQLGGTLNDILLTALSGAIRRYLQNNGEEVAGLNLRSIVPVNLRPLEERTASLGNNFGLVFLELPVGIDEPKARMDELIRRMGELKESPEAFVTYATLQSIGHLPVQAQDAIIGLFRGKATFIITNVPGPRSKVPFTGQPIDDIMFWVPQSQGVGVGLSIFSYDGEVRIGVTGDANLIPDPEKLVTAFHDEVYSLIEG